MKSFQLKTAMTVFLILISVNFLFAFVDNVVVDQNFDDDTNNFDQSWYYYDEYSFPANIYPDTSSVVDVIYSVKYRHAFPNDTVKVKDYEFKADSEGSNTFATMPFTFGSIARGPLFDYYPYVGVGTMLVPEGSSCDLRDIHYVKFRAKSRKNELMINFKLQTLDVENYSLVPNPPNDAYGYPETLITVKPSWSEIVVPIENLRIPQWGHHFEIDKSKITKLVWEVRKTNFPGIVSDTLDIDDIYLSNDPTCTKKYMPNKNNTSFHVFYHDKRLDVKWPGISFSKMSIKLIDTNGRTVLATSVNGTAGSTVTFAEKDISAGLYIIYVNGLDKKGKPFSGCSHLSVVK